METDHHLLLQKQAAAEEIIFRWDSSEDTSTTRGMIFESSDRKEIDDYLQAVDQIQRSLDSTISSSSSQQQQEEEEEVNNNKSKAAIQRIAMARLEDEFRVILIKYSSSIPAADRSSFTFQHPEDEDIIINNTPTKEEIPSDLIIMPSDDSSIYDDDLRAIAHRMITSGYSPECLHVYATSRKSFLDSAFQNLGLDKLTIDEIQRLDWEPKIATWIHAAKICVTVLFATEKSLCQHIFQTHEDVNDACFMETVKGPVIQLLNFAEAISISKRSPEKMFRILDLHDAMSDLFTTVFDSDSAEPIRVQAAEIVSRLAEAARGMLSEFENDVLREPSTVAVPGGTLHPLTRYVMNYISLISDYTQTLGELIVTKPATGSRYSDDLTTPDMDFTDHEGQSPLALHLIWIIVVLQFNLEEKSKLYKDIALAQLFIMNNVHYIVQKIKGSPELRELIGDNYLKKLTGKHKQAATRYQRATWVGVLYCLRDEGVHVSRGGFSSEVSKSVLRERFKAFNAVFGEVHRMQALWLIPDTQLREVLQISISEKLIPAYRSFLGRFESHIENGKHPENYIKYSVEDLETAVLDFFEGCAVNQPSRRRSQ